MPTTTTPATNESAGALPLIISTDTAAQYLAQDNVLFIDLCGEESYRAGHIPGAVMVAPAELMDGNKPAPGRLPSPERLTQLFERIGYQPDQTIIAYDNEGGGWAGRFIWMLDVIGHRHRTVIDGGLLAWRAEQRPESVDINTPVPSTVNLTLSSTPTIEAEEIIERHNDANFAVWDARSPAEYSGEKVLAARGGHIPNAINGEWTTLMDHQRDRRLRVDLAAYVASLGFTAEQEIATHCQSHHRSGLTYLVGKHLGLNMRAYHGSWSEWGNRTDTPIIEEQ